MVPTLPERVTSGISGLDDMLQGGFLRGAAVLVRGAPGTGKTAMGLQFLIHGVQNNEPGLLISFEEFPQSLHRDAESLGWNLRQMEKEGMLHMLFTSPQVFLSSLQTPSSPLNQLLLESDIHRIVLDSITHFTRISRNPIELRQHYNLAINGLKREGLTSLLLGEEGRVPIPRFEKGNLSYVADGIILLRYVEVESAIQRAIAILKMRGSGHTKDIRRYEIRQNGLVVTGAFEGCEGIMSGITHRIA
ncbi:MAG: AAA family ATPase [Thermoflexales bacterium]|nr:AAA family ATPase [Thermoflexales bacterium]